MTHILAPLVVNKRNPAAILPDLEAAIAGQSTFLPVPAEDRTRTELLRNHMRAGAPIDSSIALVVATSGSTGTPKGAQLTPVNLVASADATDGRARARRAAARRRSRTGGRRRAGDRAAPPGRPSVRARRSLPPSAATAGQRRCGCPWASDHPPFRWPRRHRRHRMEEGACRTTPLELAFGLMYSGDRKLLDLGPRPATRQTTRQRRPHEASKMVRQ